jgi:hypothetical protein
MLMFVPARAEGLTSAAVLAQRSFPVRLQLKTGAVPTACSQRGLLRSGGQPIRCSAYARRWLTWSSTPLQSSQLWALQHGRQEPACTRPSSACR